MQYKISELAQLAGISQRTLRHYDEIGLLQPQRIKSSNYRIYDEHQVNQLQHILILKTMGLDLEKIKEIVKGLDDKERMNLLEDHLRMLYDKRDQMNAIIENVKTTINAIKGGIIMNDKEKFEGLKEKIVSENDRLYKDEVIDKWGHDIYEKSKKAFQDMTEEQFKHKNQLEIELIGTLIKLKNDINNPILKNLVYQLHKEWLTLSWGETYNKDAHYNLVSMYVDDQRFKAYYDRHGEGLTELLRDTIQDHLINE